MVMSDSSVTSTSGKQHRPDAEATRCALLETAIDLIWRSNYDRVGVAEICSCAGVTKGAFYHHFESKEALFYEASKYHWLTFQANLDSIFSPQRTPLEQLNALVDFILKQQKEDSTEEVPVRGCPFFTSGAHHNCEESLIRKAADEMVDRGMRYYTSMLRGLHADQQVEWDSEPTAEDYCRIGRYMQCYIKGLFLYAQVKRAPELLTTDLRDALYRIVRLKKEYRQ